MCAYVFYLELFKTINLLKIVIFISGHHPRHYYVLIPEWHFNKNASRNKINYTLCDLEIKAKKKNTKCDETSAAEVQHHDYQSSGYTDTILLCYYYKYHCIRCTSDVRFIFLVLGFFYSEIILYECTPWPICGSGSQMGSYFALFSVHIFHPLIFH